MAKKKKSSKQQQARSSGKHFASPCGTTDEDGDSNTDVQSLCSTAISSPDSSNFEEDGNSDGERGSLNINENNYVDDFEDKLNDLLDSLHFERKGAAKFRLSQLSALSKAMASRFCGEYFSERQVTIQDILERALKRSQDEANYAALALSHLLITLASDDFSDDVFATLYEPLLRLLLDHTGKPLTRANCAVALSLGTFITHFGTEKAPQVMQSLLAIVSMPIRGSSTPSDDPFSLYALKTTCLNMFSFLAASSSNSGSLLQKSILHQLKSCFEAPHLPLRIAAGQCVALLVEQHEDEEEEEDMAFDVLKHELAQMSVRIGELARDSAKCRSKKELREQRNIFRQVLATVVDGEAFEIQTVTIAGHQKLDIDCWQWKHYYDTFCSVLGSGMRLHLSENPFLREVFQLGPVPLKMAGQLPPTKKVSKLEKTLSNSSSRKARELNRNKVRGKKAELRGDF